jgi:hypothetical protein
MLLFLMLACRPHGIHIGGDTDADVDTDVATDTDVAGDTDVSWQPIALGDACDPAADHCVTGTQCCTACCDEGNEPVCTNAIDGACPLPDLSIIPERLESSYRIETLPFAADDCAIAEGCVNGPGWRRLLRFSTTTPNTGTAALHFGQPGQNSDFFQYSECHQHYHFSAYANYRLLSGDGDVAAIGHKQAFCLEDYERWTDDAPRVASYDCNFQGISVGWADTYDAALDCQWIDVTDVPAGEYTLEVAINPEQLIPELSYDNNLAQVSVVISDPNDVPPPTDDCPRTTDGEYRDCGWTLGETLSCNPGEATTVGCDGGCDGQCQGDPMVRVCDGTEACLSWEAVTSVDDSAGCGHCPEAQFTCPQSGQITLMWGPWRSSSTSAECNPIIY